MSATRDARFRLKAIIAAEKSLKDRTNHRKKSNALEILIDSNSTPLNAAMETGENIVQASVTVKQSRPESHIQRRPIVGQYYFADMVLPLQRNSYTHIWN